MPCSPHYARRHSAVVLVSIACIAWLVVACDADRPLGTGLELAVSFAPTAPTTLTARAETLGEIDLAWQDNASNELGFEVRASTTGPTGSFSVWTTTYANTNTASFTGLGPGVNYCFVVTAFAKKGQKLYYSANSNTACVTTLTPPPPPPGPNAPSGVVARPDGPSRVTITWVDNSNNEEWFRPELAPSPTGPWGSVNYLLGPGYTSFTFINISTEQTLCYRVVALNAIGQTPSNVDCTAIPATPSGFTAVDAADGPALDLTWTDNSSVEDGYELRRALGTAQWATIATLPPGTVRYRDATVVTGSSYTYYLRAIKDDGGSDWASLAIVAGGVHGPPPPPELWEVSGYFTAMWLVWHVDLASTDSTRIERCSKETCTDDDFTVIATLRTTESTMWYQDYGLSDWTLYTYRLFGINRFGVSAPSAAIPGRTCIYPYDEMAPCWLPFPSAEAMGGLRKSSKPPPAGR